MSAAASHSGPGLTFVTRGAVAHAFERIRYDRLASVPAHRAGLDGVIRAPRPELLAAEFERQGSRVAPLLTPIERGPLWKPYVQKSRALLPAVDESGRAPCRDPFADALAPNRAESRARAARGRDAARGA